MKNNCVLKSVSLALFSILLIVSMVSAAEPVLQYTEWWRDRGVPQSRWVGQTFAAVGSQISSIDLYFRQVTKLSADAEVILSLYPVTVRKTLAGDLAVAFRSEPVATAVFPGQEILDACSGLPELNELAGAEEGVWVNLPISAKLTKGECYAFVITTKGSGHFVLGLTDVKDDGLLEGAVGVESTDDQGTWQIPGWEYMFRMYE